VYQHGSPMRGGGSAVGRELSFQLSASLGNFAILALGTVDVHRRAKGPLLNERSPR
jgi:hypothetical protein